jgi:hypothetical protein
MLTRWAARRAAGFVALLYIAGVLMPSAALAFADAAVTAYCFDEIAEQVASVQVHVHVHSDGTVHHHPDKSAANLDEHATAPKGTGHAPSHSHDGSCCGSFGFIAVLPALGGAIAAPAAYHIQQPILTSCLIGCGPDRIDRPPIALLPM